MQSLNSSSVRASFFFKLNRSAVTKSPGEREKNEEEDEKNFGPIKVLHDVLFRLQMMMITYLAKEARKEGGVANKFFAVSFL